MNLLHRGIPNDFCRYFSLRSEHSPPALQSGLHSATSFPREKSEKGEKGELHS
jgi:hypothetical protein